MEGDYRVIGHDSGPEDKEFDRFVDGLVVRPGGTIPAGCCIVRLLFVDSRCVAQSAIALVPTTETAERKALVVYMPYQTGPCGVWIQRYTVSEREEAPSTISYIINNPCEAHYLMFANGARVMVPWDNIKACDLVLRQTKPLFDEWAIWATRDTTNVRRSFSAEDFGTYADQVRDQILRVGNDLPANGGKEFLWRRARETDQDQNLTNLILLFKYAHDESTTPDEYFEQSNDLRSDTRVEGFGRVGAVSKTG